MSSSLSTAPLWPLNLTGEQHLDLLRTIHGIAQSASDAQTATPEKAETTTETINYEALKTEHAELISSGKTSIEIASWLGEKLGIESWKSGAFLGERKVLTTPTPAEMVRLQQFTQALGISWSKANGWSDNHSQFLLMDGYVQNALFGQANMREVDARLDTFHADWQRMWRDFTAKAKYLKEKVGLDIKGDWDKLTGIRSDDGGFDCSGGLYASGSLDGHVVRSLWLGRVGSYVYFFNASSARLCFLA